MPCVYGGGSFRLSVVAHNIYVNAKNNIWHGKNTTLE